MKNFSVIEIGFVNTGKFKHTLMALAVSAIATACALTTSPSLSMTLATTTGTNWTRILFIHFFNINCGK